MLSKNKISIQEYNELIKKSKTKKNDKHKYGAKQTEVDNIRFDSKWEAKRYCELKILEKNKQIVDLKLQLPFSLDINNIKICNYIADFVYKINSKELKNELKDFLFQDNLIIEDAKGFITPEYKLKKKLMKAVHGINIFETRAKQNFKR